MQTQTTQQNNTFVDGTRLVWQLMRATKQKLFGGTVVASPGNLGSIEIPNGNVQAFLAARLAQSGIVGVQVPQTAYLDEAIVTAANAIAKATGAADTFSTKQLQRKAVEYLAQACMVPPQAVEPFEQYLDHAKELRDAYRALNAVEGCSKEDAFTGSKKMQPQQAAKLAKDAGDAWGKIQVLRAKSPQLAAIQDQIYVSPILDAHAWSFLAELEPQMRSAVLQQIGSAIAQSGNPLVNVRRAQQVSATVQGTAKHLTNGNRNGVDAQTYIHATEQAGVGGVKPNGGKTVQLTGIPTAFLGQQISGLHGGADAQIVVTPDGLQITADIREGQYPTRFLVPLAGQGQHFGGFASAGL